MEMELDLLAKLQLGSLAEILSEAWEDFAFR